MTPIVEGYEFSIDGYSLYLSGGELKCAETGIKRYSKGVLFFKYLPLLLEDQLVNQGAGVDFSMVKGVSESPHSVNISSLRRCLDDVTGIKGVGRKAIPYGTKSRPTNPVFRSEFQGIIRHVIDSSNSLLSDSDEDGHCTAYEQRNQDVRVAEAHMGALIDHLVELFPDDLADYFLTTDSGRRLPIFVMDEARFGKPVWPMPVHDSFFDPPERGRESLHRQRYAEGANLYNGNIYRLVEATPEAWSLGKTRYFDVLECCDILRGRLFAEWGQAYARGPEAQKAALRTSPWVAEWLALVRAVKAGDFSGYAAGMGMNMPIFVSNDDQLILLLGEGCQSKAAGGGKLHVCPAGMMEFHKNTLSNTLTFENFRTMLVRELHEEAFRSPVLVEDVVHGQLEGNFLPKEGRSADGPVPEAAIGGGGFEFLEGLFNKAEAYMAQMGDDCSPLRLSRHVRSLPATTPTYQVVDAFRLRPEIVLPVHLDYLPHLALGWEYQHADVDLVRIPSLDALEDYVSTHWTRWAEPGLGGFYLAARDILRRQGKDQSGRAEPTHERPAVDKVTQGGGVVPEAV